MCAMVTRKSATRRTRSTGTDCSVGVTTIRVDPSARRAAPDSFRNNGGRQQSTTRTHANVSEVLCAPLPRFYVYILVGVPCMHNF